MAVFEGQAHLEKTLHEAFAAEREVGEWFRPCEDLMALAAMAEAPEDLLARYGKKIKARIKTNQALIQQRSTEMQQKIQMTKNRLLEEERSRAERKRIREAEELLARQRLKQRVRNAALIGIKPTAT